MPSTPYDAKGLLAASIRDEDPVIYVDDRWLYKIEGEVPEELYTIPFGKGIIRREGRDVTIVATSYMVHEAMKAAEHLGREGVDVEILDLRSLKPLDEKLLFNSVKKTGRLIILDGGWKTCGIGAEISAKVAENSIFKQLEAPIIRVALPDTPAPASPALEKFYYRNVKDIILAVRKVIK
jgi:pyruvate dehydrogenase E1 component beta subunit